MTTARALALVAFAWLAIVAVCAVWFALDRRPPEGDDANHLERSSFYPPLVPCAAGLVYRAVPSDAAGAQSVILLFLGVGMVAVYLLGRRLATGAAGRAAGWHHRDILAALERDSRGLPATVSVVPNAAFFSVSNFRSYAVRDGFVLRFMRAWRREPLGVAYLGPSWTAAVPRAVVERVTLGWLPLPTGPASWIVRPYDPSRGIAARLPFPVAVGPIAVTPEAIRVGAPPSRGGS